MRDEPGTVRILVTGWRHWPRSHRDVVWNALDSARWDFHRNGELMPRIVVVQGECPYGGADLYAKEWAEFASNRDRCEVEPHPAEYDAEGRILGPARNSRMVDAGADLCLGFPGPKSRGTWDCLRKAVDADIPTRIFPWASKWADRSDD